MALLSHSSVYPQRSGHLVDRQLSSTLQKTNIAYRHEDGQIDRQTDGRADGQTGCLCKIMSKYSFYSNYNNILLWCKFKITVIRKQQEPIHLIFDRQRHIHGKKPD